MGRLTHTVSGSIATVRSPAVAPIENLKVHFSPIQEGTGDPSPSNVRPITGWTGVTGYKSGKNLIDYNALTVFDIGDDYGERRGFIFTKPGTYYIKSLKTWENNSYIYCRVKNADGTYGNIQYFVAVKTVTNRTITIGSGQTLLIFNSVKTTEPSGTIEATIERFDGWGVVVSFNDVDSYESYSGEIIPVTFPSVGKNLFNINAPEAVPISTGSGSSAKRIFTPYTRIDGTSGTNYIAPNACTYSINGNTINLNNKSGYGLGYAFKLAKNKVYTISGTIDNSNLRIGLSSYSIDGTFTKIWESHTFENASFTVPADSDIILITFLSVSGAWELDVSVSNIQLELGSTATAYEPYSSDNTVYGGYVDLATGEIFTEYVYLKTTWGGYYSSKYTRPELVNVEVRRFNLNKITKGASWFNDSTIRKQFVKCNVAPWNWNWNNDNTHFYVAYVESDLRSYAYLFMPIGTSDDTEIEFCAYLETPQLIATLTPQELATFKGYSNFWSNAGDVDVTYQVVESSEMTKERQKIFAGNAPSIHTASGSIANFEMEPGLNRNLKSCKVGFLPVQEGSGDPFPPINQNGSIVGVDNTHNESELSSFKIHFSPIQSGSGDPSPTNVRPITGWTGVTGYKGGKNLLDPSTHYTASHYESQGITFDLNSDGSVTINGTVVEGASSSPQFSFYWTQPITGNYYFCANIPYSGTYNEIYMYDNTVGARCRQWDGVSNGLSSHSARPLCEAQLIAGHRISLVIRISRDTGFAYNNVTCSPMLMASNCTDTTFEPYSAPTSYPITFPGVGKNLFDEQYPDIYTEILYRPIYVGNSDVTASTDAIRPQEATLLYVLPGNVQSGASTGSNGIWDGQTRTVTPVNGYITIAYRMAYSVSPASYHTQIEIGSTATSYEPYTNTLYGGYVDLVSGEVWKIYGIVEDLSTLYWRYEGPNDNYNFQEYLSTDLVNIIAKTSSSDDQHCIACSKYKAIDRTTQYGNRVINTIASTTGGQIRIYSEGVSTYSTVQEFKESLSGVSLVYQLATPILVTTLTPQQIALATGNSSYWSNADAVTVETAGNVRPIKGWGKPNTTRCGKNLYHYDENNVKVESLNSGLVRAVYHTGIYGDGRNFVLSAHRKDPNVGSTANINLGYCKNGINYVPDYFITTSEERTPTCKRLSGEEITLVLVSASDTSLKSNLQRFDIQIEFGTTPSTYEAYNGNIYPTVFPVQGKNLLDPTYRRASGSNIYYYKGHPITLQPGTYTASCSVSCSGLYVTENDDDVVSVAYDSTYLTFTLNESKDVFFNFYKTNGIDLTATCQLELGSSKTSYEPYDNSIFGGYVNLVTGEVIATYAKITYDGSEDESWYVAANYNSSGLTRVNINTIIGKSSGDILFNYGKKTSTQSSWNGWMSSANHNMLMFIPNEINSKAAWLAYLSKNPLEIVCELETPVLVTTLTPTQIQALKGTNNILSDANGTIEVKYWSH